MIVKELIERLQKCDPEATVYTEQWQEMDVNVVGIVESEKIVYIADDLDALRVDMEEEKRILKEVK